MLATGNITRDLLGSLTTAAALIFLMLTAKVRINVDVVHQLILCSTYIDYGSIHLPAFQAQCWDVCPQSGRRGQHVSYVRLK